MSRYPLDIEALKKQAEAVLDMRNPLRPDLRQPPSICRVVLNAQELLDLIAELEAGRRDAQRLDVLDQEINVIRPSYMVNFETLVWRRDMCEVVQADTLRGLADCVLAKGERKP